ncbi:hypothetical protein V4C53_47505, partial [Paraburkholderia azotifigens]|uniref:hypothetical protein n=1 Tax=Paraburkholderia azotifigens TaxID=2057004 RepID=UPI003177C332
AAMRTAIGPVRSGRALNRAAMLFEGEKGKYNAMHGRSVLDVCTTPEKHRTISEQRRPSCYPSCLALRAVIDKTSSWLTARQSHPSRLILRAT